MEVSARRHNTDDIIATVLAVEPMKFIYRGRSGRCLFSSSHKFDDNEIHNVCKVNNLGWATDVCGILIVKYFVTGGREDVCLLVIFAIQRSRTAFYWYQNLWLWMILRDLIAVLLFSAAQWQCNKVTIAMATWLCVSLGVCVTLVYCASLCCMCTCNGRLHHRGAGLNSDQVDRRELVHGNYTLHHF